MAKLNSIKKDYSFSIKPLNYESKGEEWIVVEIIFGKDDKNILKKVASVIQESEIKDIFEKIITVGNNKISYRSEFLEPNLKLSFEEDKEGIVRVIADYVEGENYEDREDKKNYHKNIEFFTDRDSINFFTESLKAELQSVQTP